MFCFTIQSNFFVISLIQSRGAPASSSRIVLLLQMPAEPDHRSPGNPLVMLLEVLGAPFAAQVTKDPHRLGDMLHGSVAVVVGPAENLLITFDDQGHPRLPVLVAGDRQGPTHRSRP